MKKPSLNQLKNKPIFYFCGGLADQFVSLSFVIAYCKKNNIKDPFFFYPNKKVWDSFFKEKKEYVREREKHEQFWLSEYNVEEIINYNLVDISVKDLLFFEKNNLYRLRYNDDFYGIFRGNDISCKNGYNNEYDENIFNIKPPFIFNLTTFDHLNFFPFEEFSKIKYKGKLNSKNKLLKDEIANNESVIIHIRKKDKGNNIYLDIDCSEVIEKILDSLNNNIKIFCFSNQIEYAKQMLSKSKYEITYVSNNSILQPATEIEVMKSGKYFITTSGYFGKLAFFLSDTKDKEIFNIDATGKNFSKNFN